MAETLEPTADSQKVMMLDISTAHITKRDSKLLHLACEGNNQRLSMALSVSEVMAGAAYFIYVDEDRQTDQQLIDAGLSLALVRIIDDCRDMGISYLKLDCDAPNVREWPTFDWEDEDATT